MMTLKNAIKTLDDVIPPHTHRTVDREHMPIVLAWEAVKVELENRLPVVRCRECKHYRNHPNGLCYAHTEPDDNERGYKGEAVCVEPEDFCSYGERKNDFVDDNKIGERRADER